MPSARRTVVLDNSNSECQTYASPNLPLVGCTMRIGLLLFAVLLMVVPVGARGSRSGYSRSSSSRNYSSHSTKSYHSRPSTSSSRSHSSTRHAYRNRPAHSSSRSVGMGSPRSRQTASSGSVQRDSQGKIKRSAASKNAFKRKQPCPSTGKSRGACPGYVIDHVKPLECGGADAPSNMQWQTVAAGKAKDKTERYCR